MQTLSYTDKVLLIGSCFSDNIGIKLQQAKFQVLFNPTGIVFDPVSLAKHLTNYATNKQYRAEDLFQYSELWHSWDHHSDFSTTEQTQTTKLINDAIQLAHQHLETSSFLFLTLGTAYSYQLKNEHTAVANCHKAPKDWFDKKLLSIESILTCLKQGIEVVRELNPTIKIVFTVSPVKHIRDGIIENNRSKARLIEAVHQLAETETNCSYFPAYELVTDVLRDYRFYAPDMAHPNEQAIQFVFEHFCHTFMDTHTQTLMMDVRQIVSAKTHIPHHPDTDEHRKFLRTFLDKIERLRTKIPSDNWVEEITYFGGAE